MTGSLPLGNQIKKNLCIWNDNAELFVQRGEGCIFPFPKKHEKHFRAGELERWTTLGRGNQTSAACVHLQYVHTWTPRFVYQLVLCVCCAAGHLLTVIAASLLSPPLFLYPWRGHRAARFLSPALAFLLQQQPKCWLGRMLTVFSFYFQCMKVEKWAKKKEKAKKCIVDSEKEFRQVKMVAYIWSEEKTNRRIKPHRWLKNIKFWLLLSTEWGRQRLCATPEPWGKGLLKKCQWTSHRGSHFPSPCLCLACSCLLKGKYVREYVNSRAALLFRLHVVDADE